MNFQSSEFLVLRLGLVIKIDDMLLVPSDFDHLSAVDHNEN